MLKVSITLALAIASGAVQSSCPRVPTSQRYVINGIEVTDRTTGLTWARCSAGQAWDGKTCAGAARTFTRDEADAYVKGLAGWRLPTTDELTSILERGCTDPAIDTTAFPSTPTDWFWSDAPDSRSSNFFRHVFFYNGELKNYEYRHYYYRARLVKSNSR